MLIIKYWQAILAALTTAILAYGLHTISMSFAEHGKASALAEQHDLLTKSCNDQQTRTKEANDALQQTAADISSKLASYKRLHPSACVMPGKGKAQPSAGGSGHADGDGISSDWLREYAAQCEAYRQERIILENAQ